MQIRPWIIATALVVAAAAAGGAHLIALSCCSTRLSIVGLFWFGLVDGYWFDRVLAAVLTLGAVVALASYGVARVGPANRAAFSRLAEALMLAGLLIAVAAPIVLWVFVFAPGIDRYFGGAWTYFNLQSPLVETLMDITIGSLVVALAGWARLKTGRSEPRAAN